MPFSQVRCVGSVGVAGPGWASGNRLAPRWLPPRPAGQLLCDVWPGLSPIGDQAGIIDHGAVQVVEIDAAVICQPRVTLARVLGDRLAVLGGASYDSDPRTASTSAAARTSSPPAMTRFIA
jgi:hypothetical protein